MDRSLAFRNADRTLIWGETSQSEDADTVPIAVEEFSMRKIESSMIDGGS